MRGRPSASELIRRLEGRIAELERQRVEVASEGLSPRNLDYQRGYMTGYAQALSAIKSQANYLQQKKLQEMGPPALSINIRRP